MHNEDVADILSFKKPLLPLLPSSVPRALTLNNESNTHKAWGSYSECLVEVNTKENCINQAQLHF